MSYDPECCPLVVDPLTFTALLAFICAASGFLAVQITMLLRRKRRKRGVVNMADEPSVQEAFSNTVMETLAEVIKGNGRIKMRDVSRHDTGFANRRSRKEGGWYEY